jgi:hypothetical protein
MKNLPLGVQTFSDMIEENYLYVDKTRGTTHTLTLEVTDGEETALDDMQLTILNSPPNASPNGGGIFEINADVTLGGYVSDFDGDLLSYQWMEGAAVLFSGTVQVTEINPRIGWNR